MKHIVEINLNKDFNETIKTKDLDEIKIDNIVKKHGYKDFKDFIDFAAKVKEIRRRNGIF
jgi:hypothetical protein